MKASSMGLFSRGNSIPVLQCYRWEGHQSMCGMQKTANAIFHLGSVVNPDSGRSQESRADTEWVAEHWDMLSCVCWQQLACYTHHTSLHWSWSIKKASCFWKWFADAAAGELLCNINTILYPFGHGLSGEWPTDFTVHSMLHLMGTGKRPRTENSMWC